MYAARNEACSPLPSAERVIEFAVDHQCRHPHVRQSFGIIGVVPGHEYLRDGFAVQPRLALDPHIEEVPPEPAVSEGWRNKVAQMLDVKVLQALAIIVDAALITAA